MTTKQPHDDTSFHRRFDAVPGRKFPLGAVTITDGAVDAVSPEDASTAVSRHARGDWGDCSPEDAAANDRALATGERLLSIHHSAAGATFYVITEADRSATTVLLPEEY